MVERMVIRNAAQPKRKLYKLDVMVMVLSYLEPRERLRMQSVCRLFYDKQVPTALTFMEGSGKANMLRGLTEMLSARPDGAGFATISTWLRMEPLKIELLEAYWRLVESEGQQPLKLIDPLNTDLVLDVKKGKERHSGMFLKKIHCGGELIEHGIVKKVRPGPGDEAGTCIEGSYKFGQPHGLHRVTGDLGAKLELYRDGVKVAQLEKERH